MLDASARSELIELTHRYFRGVDTKDAEVLASCLAKDMAAEHSMVGGVQGLDEFIAVIRSLPSQVLVTQHYLSNHEIEGAGEEAQVRAYLFAQHAVQTNKGVELMPGGAFYEFQCRRETAGWRITWLRNTVRWSDPRLADIFKPPS